MNDRDFLKSKATRNAFLIRLEREMSKTPHFTPAFDEWLVECDDIVKKMPLAEVETLVPLLTEKFIEWIILEDNFIEWEREIQNKDN